MSKIESSINSFIDIINCNNENSINNFLQKVENNNIIKKVLASDVHNSLKSTENKSVGFFEDKIYTNTEKMNETVRE